MPCRSIARAFGLWMLVAGVQPVAAQLVINEIMQNPSAVSDGDGEWFEIFNPGSTDIDINGWTIRDDGSDSHVIDNGGPLSVPAGGYLVLGANADSSQNGGLNVDYEYVDYFLANGADEVILEDTSNAVVDSVFYDGGPGFPDPTGASMALTDPDLDNAVGPNWVTSTDPFGSGDLGTPGADNGAGGGGGGPVTDALIHEIQGTGDSSPLVATRVRIEGVVVGDFEGSAGLSGFFVQEEDSDADGDPATSEGIFVFNGGAFQVDAGDRVRVEGLVSEFNDLTELTDPVVEVLASNVLGEVSTALINDLGGENLERLEGMRVELTQELFVTEYFQLGRFGSVVLSVGGRLQQPTQITSPGPSANALQAQNDRRRIVLDDGSGVQNPATILFGRGGNPVSGDNILRGGDTLAGISGILDERFGAYRVQRDTGAPFIATNSRSSSPPFVSGGLRVASFNVLNYFTTIDDGNNGARGADSTSEFERQEAKLVTALLSLDADLVGLVELENNGDTALASLVEALNTAAGSTLYAFVATGSVGGDVIRVGFIYKPATVETVGDPALLDSSVDSQFIDDRNRPVIAQTFRQKATGGVVTVAVNHLKSKGTPCDDIGDPDLGDGQGNCNVTRTTAAQALVNWLAGDPTGSGDPDFLIIGDLNAYAMEDPITAIKAGGYTDLIRSFAGTDTYSFVFDGQAGYLDHALASSGLVAQVTGAGLWPINADELNIYDYNEEFNPTGFFDPAIPYRASDHDPVVLGLRLDRSAAPRGADLAVTKSDDQDPVRVRQSLTYRLEVTNLGPDTARRVQVTDILPSGMQFVSASTRRCHHSNGVVSCALGRLRPGQSRMVTLRVTPRSRGTLINTATVTASAPDPDLSNNVAFEDTEVTGRRR